MGKSFNVNGNCIPGLHYMVDLTERLVQIKAMVDAGQYFTINRARQYGKTTLLKELAKFLREDYIVASLDFQRMSYANFENERAFVMAFADELLDSVENMPDKIREKLDLFAEGNSRNFTLQALFRVINKWCGQAGKGVVLTIDEVDSATNNQVFLDFLAQLRGCYIGRDVKPTFQSVILSGVYDVRNIKGKLRPEEEHKTNSPWNIAADFLVDMNFSVSDITGMLAEYEEDYKTGMKIHSIAEEIYDYTSGYPFLVSRICKLIDERVTGSEGYPDRIKAWTKEGVTEAVKILLSEKNTLFESLVGKLDSSPELRKLIYGLLFNGNAIPYHSLNRTIEMAEMFGFVKNVSGNVAISNRIFETILYNLFLSEEAVSSEIYKVALQEKSQFFYDGRLNMDYVLERFVVHFNDLYGELEESFLEEAGRRYFLLYLKPIINGKGNYYIEAQTRNMERTDIIVDYLGEQFVIELKIWRGNAYNERGEAQLLDYLDHYHLKKGYMISFNFNKKKQIGMKEIVFGEKVLVEAIV